jgi:hypothetical protein
MQTGIKSDSLVQSCGQFFEKEAILEAKKILFELAAYKERCVKHVKEEDNVVDIGKMLQRCAKDRKSLAKYVIYDPPEVPATSELVGVYAISKINEMCKKVEKAVIHIQQLPVPVDQSPVEKSGKVTLLYLVVVKNPPKTLSTAEARKSVIDSACGTILDKSAIEIRRGRSDFKFLVDSI